MLHNPSDPDRLKKLKFRAWRRGFREADLILGPFADETLALLTAEELDEFEELLHQPDQDLYAWIVELQPTPPRFDTPLMSRIKTFRFRARESRADEVGG
jgi:antitoxin CptB